MRDNLVGCIFWNKTYAGTDKLLAELYLTYDSRKLISELSIGKTANGLNCHSA